MNLILFSIDEVIEQRLILSLHPRNHLDKKPNNNPAIDLRQQHIAKVLKPNIGDTLRVGLRNGQLGVGTVLSHNAQATELSIQLTHNAHNPLPLRLLLALPRPKMLRRILQTCATLGVQEIKLINTSKVDKSYWQTPFLQPHQVEENFLLGMQQGGLTHMPILTKAPLFKPFVEDDLSTWAKGHRMYLAHPRATSNASDQDSPTNLAGKHADNYAPSVTSNAHSHFDTANVPTCLAIGPEGGFTDYEVNKLTDQGFQCISLGARILQVETAIVVAIAQQMHL